MEALRLVKIGGKLLDDASALEQVIRDFSKIDGPKILVHGGGKKASELCRKMGIQPQLKEGRRITDETTLDIVTMVYAGLLNKNIVSQLQSHACNAIGFSGADANMIRSKKRAANPIDFGFVGDIETINSVLLKRLLNQGLTPVFCAITHDGKGQLLNTNADTIAASLAATLANDFEVLLKFCFEKEGVLANPLDDASVFPFLSKKEYELYRQKGTISDGMIPKLDNAFAAKAANVHRVMICGVSGIFEQKGTEICL